MATKITLRQLPIATAPTTGTSETKNSPLTNAEVDQNFVNLAAAVDAAAPASGGTISGATITGSTVNSTSIGSTTRSSGAFTTLNANGAARFEATTASTSTTTGAVVVDGGVGIAGAVNAGSFVGDGSGLTNLDAADITTGTLVVSRGGTGAGSLTGYVKGNGTSAFTASSQVPVGDVSGLGTGVATFLATPSSANLATAVTDETGSGSLVFATSPTLVTPNLGTPSAATLTNATGLPVSTGISGLGTGVATFLATPSSANLAAAVTGETGSGALVFATSPALVTPSLSGATVSTSAAVSAAGNTQASATALTNDINVVTTATAGSAFGVRLAAATAGRSITVVNRSATAITVYPDTGATIDGLAANAGISVPSGSQIEFIASSATQWYSSANNVAPASAIGVSDNNTNATFYPTFTNTTSGNINSLSVDATTGALSYNPSTGQFSATSFSADTNVKIRGTASGVTTVQSANASTTNYTLSLPAVTGTFVTTGDTGSVTSTMIADGTIVNADINASAAIAVSKLAANTISGITLGGNLNTLTMGVAGTGLSGSATYNGGTATTFTVTSNATSANTASTIVARDASGNFSAGTITAALSGNASTATTAGNVTGTVAIANGGTGQTTAANARTALGAAASGANSDITSITGLTTALSVGQGGTGATTAANARTNLGATTLGSNIFTLANVAAISFPRFNADNTISSLDAATFRTAIGAGTGNGTVTSVAVSGSNISVTGSPITGSGTISISIPQAVATTSNVQFGSFGVGTAASGTSGEIRATNNITAYFSSDRKFKENVREVTNAIDIVSAISSKTFDWTEEYIKSHGGEDGYFVKKQDFGVIAQEVQAVFPLAVREREDGSLAVNYEKLAVLSFAAIKELSLKLAELELLVNSK